MMILFYYFIIITIIMKLQFENGYLYSEETLE